MRNSAKAFRTVASVALAAFGLSAAAAAGPYSGSKVSLTNGVGDTRSLFTISGSNVLITTVRITGDLSGVNTYYLDGVQLVGIRSLYLVNPDGSAATGITTVANAGFVQDGTTKVKTLYNGSPSFGGYTGYDDDAPGKGFSDGSHFLVVANPTLALKAASNAATKPNNDTFGSFDFDSSKPLGNYDIGLDYILKGGQTGRAYFALPAALPPAPAVPEPGSLVSMALGSLGLAGLMLRARKRQAPQTA